MRLRLARLFAAIVGFAIPIAMFGHDGRSGLIIALAIGSVLSLISFSMKSSQTGNSLRLVLAITLGVSVFGLFAPAVDRTVQSDIVFLVGGLMAG